MNAASGSLSVMENICQELLTRLSSDSTDRGRAFATQAEALLRKIERWSGAPPSPEERTIVIAKVLDLHRTAMEHLTVVGHKRP
jgi:hypothetical protein